jgi:hypothetical protein
VRLLACGVLALALVATAGGAAPAATHGFTIVGGKRVDVRFAAAFMRATTKSGDGGGYAIVLSDKRLRCTDLYKLPVTNPIGDRWALVALYPTKDGFPQTGPVRGEMEYPVGDAYASLTRNVSINLRSAGLFPGVLWRGTVRQGARKVEDRVYAVNATFAARWCG